MVKKFELRDEYIELIKLLKVTGLCGSGGMAKVITSQGGVKVDGIVELRKRCKKNPKRATVEFQGTFIEARIVRLGAIPDNLVLFSA